MSTPEVWEFEVAGAPEVLELLVEGPQGRTGNPGIIVSATEPESPQENDLWLEIPPDE